MDVNATDIEGAISATVSTSIRIGPAPADSAPELSNVQVAITAQCATVTGEVVDINQNLGDVSIDFSSGNEAATINANLFSVQACNLPGGAQTATVVATDTTNLTATAVVNFTIDAGVTATLSEHINADRLDYTNYANCYLEYGTNPFKLNKVEVSLSQCTWQDNDAS